VKISFFLDFLFSMFGLVTGENPLLAAMYDFFRLYNVDWDWNSSGKILTKEEPVPYMCIFKLTAYFLSKLQ
jgi:hypothetical protein